MSFTVYNNPLKYSDPSGYLSAMYENWDDYYAEKELEYIQGSADADMKRMRDVEDNLFYRSLTGRILPEVNVRDGALENRSAFIRRVQHDLDHLDDNGGWGISWTRVNTGLQVAEGFGVAAAAGREIALDYRMSQPFMKKVGMSANLKVISGLGTASKWLGAAGYGAAGLGTVLDINAYNKGQMSATRLGYNTSGTAVGLGVSYFLGPVAGAAAGASFYVGQQMYDGYNWWAGQMSIYLTNLENGLKNGWVPGR